MITFNTPEGVAAYFESYKKIQQKSVEEQLSKQFTPQSKPKRKRVIGFFCGEGNDKKK